MAAIWILPAGEVIVANTHDAAVPPVLIRELRAEVLDVLDNRHYNDEAGEVLACCRLNGCLLATTKPGSYPHTDGRTAVRQVFHRLRDLWQLSHSTGFAGIS